MMNIITTQDERYKNVILYNIICKMYIPIMVVIATNNIISATIACVTVGTVDAVGNAAFCKE